MGITKIRHQGPGKANDAEHFPLNYTLDELVEEDRLLLEKDHSNDPDGSELSDAGCEYALVDNQICNIPYELYELPNLKEILSLENWNVYLTEEERFSLAAYLPDMNPETFGLMMLELLSGSNLFFGNPLEILFNRLKGGFYSLPVAHFREGLKFLQERGYYYSLRSYHESMGQKFVEMRKTWSNQQPNTSVEELVQIWNNKKKQKPVFLVDLNAFPTEEDHSSKGEKKVMVVLPTKKKRCMNEEVSTHVPATDLNGMASNNRIKAKGVLKIKPFEMNSTSKQVVSSVPTESWESLRRPPKGVLKIKPKGYPTSLVERPTTMPFLPDQSSASSPLALHQSKLPPSHFSSQWKEENLNRKLTYLHQSIRDSSVCRDSLTPLITNDQQSGDTLNLGSRLFDNAQNSLRKMKTVKGIRMYSDDPSGFGERFASQQTRALCTSSAGLYQSGPDNDQMQIMPVHTNASEAASKNSTTVTNDYQIFPKCPGHSEHRYRNENDGESVERSHIFPITYKRKKSYTKLGAVQNLKQPSMVTGMELTTPNAADLHKVEKTKSIKIRMKGWNEFNSQHKAGMINVQHHGSPST